MMNKPKYQIGDRFSVNNTVNCEIVHVIEGKPEVAYIFQLSADPTFKSAVTEKQLDKVIANQKSA